MSKFAEQTMSAAAFKKWRKKLGLSQKEAAKALGLKPRIIQYYEKGERDGRALEVPKSVRLACQALLTGIMDFDGEKVFVVPEGKTLSSALDQPNSRDTSVSVSDFSLPA